MLETYNNKIVTSDDSKANKIVVNLFKNNKSRKLTDMPNIRAIKKFIFLIPNTKKVFNYLQLVFIKTLIFQYFNLKIHI